MEFFVAEDCRYISSLSREDWSSIWILGFSPTVTNLVFFIDVSDSPRVEFCGYSNPHPSENKIHLRIQMYGT